MKQFAAGILLALIFYTGLAIGQGVYAPNNGTLEIDFGNGVPLTIATGPAGIIFPGIAGSSNAQSLTTANNQVIAYNFRVPAMTVDRFVWRVDSAAGGSSCGWAVYQDTTSAPLVEVKTDCGTTGIKDIDVTNTTIGPGGIIIAYTSTDSGVSIEGDGADTERYEILNSGTVQIGIATNVSVAGVFPSTLGVITASERPAGILKLQP